MEESRLLWTGFLRDQNLERVSSPSKKRKEARGKNIAERKKHRRALQACGKKKRGQECVE